MILGIDTSNYTTSICVLEKNKILFDLREMLTVKKGMKGLRQSEAFYQHIIKLPVLINKIKDQRIEGVCVSAYPRRVEGSYMPCFKAGERIATIISDTLHVPLHKTTHQEGHIEAGLYGNKDIADIFICVHMSGGTTEILLCSKDEQGYASQIIGKTIDISAGQLIDRIGCMLGMDFPCGKEMDVLYDSDQTLKLPVSVKGTEISFSGVENQCKLYNECGIKSISIIGGVFNCVAESIMKAVKHAAVQYNIQDILFVGGVSGSDNIRKMFLSNKDQLRLYFPHNFLSSDSAVGVALIGSRMMCEGRNG